MPPAEGGRRQVRPKQKAAPHQDCRKGRVWGARARNGVHQEALRTKPINPEPSKQQDRGGYGQVILFCFEGKGTILQEVSRLKKQCLVIAVSRAIDSEETLGWIRPMTPYIFFLSRRKTFLHRMPILFFHSKLIQSPSD